MFRKKSLVMLSVLSITLGSVTVHASAKTANYKGSMVLPIAASQPAFEVSIAALALKAGASNLNYVIYNKELPTQSPSWYETEINPSFAPAFELGVGYFFPNSAGANIHLDWTHLYSNTSSSTAAGDASHFLGPDYEIGPNGLVIRNAHGNAKFRYDVLNLDVGQFIDFGHHVDMRLFGGLSTGFLREEVTANYSGTTPAPYAGPFSMTQDVVSNFTAIGPRAGIHVDVNTNSGFGFLGEAAVSGLIGSMYSKTSYTGSAAQLLALYGQTINSQTIEDQRVYQVIPGFDGKLGVNYKLPFGRDGLFMVSAGYQAAVYVNAISQYLPGSLVSGTGLETGGIFVATMSHTLSNYSVQGPFLNFSVLF